MKNILFAILIFMPILSFAQSEDIPSIAANKTSIEGVQTIATHTYWHRTSFTDTHPIGYSIFLSVFPDGDKRYSLSIFINSSNKHTLPKNGLLLIKTLDGSIIEAHQISKEYNTCKSKIEYGTITYTISGLYDIEYEDLFKIASDGIQKIRIETSLNYIESEYKLKKSKEISKSFGNMLYSLENELSTNKKDIRTDF